MFEGCRVLVTGGGGFIGSHLIERLVEQRAIVTTVDRHSKHDLHNLAGIIDLISAIELDLITDDFKGLLRRSQFHLAFHLAASTDFRDSVANPTKDFEQNAIATLSLLEAFRSASPSTEIVHASSALVYSSCDGSIGEDAPKIPNSPYGISKLAAEQYVSVYAGLYGMKTVIARLFPVFGPRLRKHVVYEIIARLHSDGTRLRMRGDGTEVRDFTYVADVATALMILAKRAAKNGEAYNVASGQHVSVDELIRVVASTMGLAPAVEYSGPERSGATSELRADISRLSALSYSPGTSLEQGVENTVQWALENLARTNAMPQVS